jgi:hypothetical protein
MLMATFQSFEENASCAGESLQTIDLGLQFCIVFAPLQSARYLRGVSVAERTGYIAVARLHANVQNVTSKAGGGIRCSNAGRRVMDKRHHVFVPRLYPPLIELRNDPDKDQKPRRPVPPAKKGGDLPQAAELLLEIGVEEFPTSSSLSP